MLQLVEDDDQEEEDDEEVLPVEREWLDQDGDWQENEIRQVQENVENLEFHLEAQKLIKTTKTRFKRLDCTAHVADLSKFSLVTYFILILTT